MIDKKVGFLFFSLAAHGKGISGGDRIFIELARRWKKNARIVIYVNEEGRKLCQRQNLRPSSNLSFVVWQTGFWKIFGFIGSYFGRIINSVINSLKLAIVDEESTIIYSASEFWMDSLPCFILKKRFPKVRWIASWYQTAPNPLIGFTEGRRENTYKLRAVLYWLVQLPVKPIISRFANFILVNNEKEKRQFSKQNKEGKVLVVLGAVDLEKIEKWKAHSEFVKDLKIANLPKAYDAVFQGRFHPQKGVVELIDIWRKVVDKLPNAKLAMIGDGPLRKDVELKIKNYKLGKNIKLLGYIFDGPKKYRIFSQSKIVVHPAFFDSGGMASAEAMVFGIPAVGFSLDSYKSYYPKGMLKVKGGNLDDFSSKVVGLLENDHARQRLGKVAQRMIKKNWSWDKRASELFSCINGY